MKLNFRHRWFLFHSGRYRCVITHVGTEPRWELEFCAGPRERAHLRYFSRLRHALLFAWRLRKR